MFKFCRVGCWVRPGVWVAVLLIPAMLLAADAPKKGRNKAKAAGEKIDIFDGIEKGQLEVKLIPQNEKKSQLLIKNKTDRPLSVRLPAAFAGVPVLAQGFPMFDQQDAPQQVGGGPQGPFGQNFMNLGMPNQNQNQNFFNMPGFMFSIAPEKVGKLRLTTVCLDHDKKTPRPQIKYEIKPIQDAAKKPGVAEVCALLSKGMVNQRVAQLAAWHLNNGKTWEELASKTNQGAFAKMPRYSKTEIKAARELAKRAVEMAGNGKKADSSSKD